MVVLSVGQLVEPVGPAIAMTLNAIDLMAALVT